ncbi:hypothetical protein PIB30_080955 [Stylosanthes scabra]|uniref:Uncharacterized protein n=1 Tax=Stylosanthes scabra TaxID=79078 RepID=A0ABU6UU68_9FABA|nr:hypothetical protein [Stylosanthes scabra]
MRVAVSRKLPLQKWTLNALWVQMGDSSFMISHRDGNINSFMELVADVIRFGLEARAVILKCIEELVDAVKVTMDPKMDKKGKKTILYPRPKIYAKAAAAKTPIAPTPPFASPSALPKPTKKELIITDLTKDSNSEEKARQKSQERKLKNTFHRMLRIGKAGSPDSYQGTPSTTFGSSDDDDFLRDESMYWEYGNIDMWKVMAPDESSEGSFPGEPPNP